MADEKTLMTFCHLTKEETQDLCRDANEDCAKTKSVGGEHTKVEDSNRNSEYEKLITKIKLISDKMITSQEPEIIRGCVKEIQMNSPNYDFAEFCESFFTGDSTRVDIRREVLKLVDKFKKQQIMADIELVAKKHNMPVDELMELITESEEN